MPLTAEQFAAATGCARGVALTWATPVANACRQYEIDTPGRMAGFLAHTGHESAGFTRTVENLNYSAEALLRTWPNRYTPQLAALQAHHADEIANHVYGGRMGNKDPGDGWKFRGRGLLMNTGRANYEAMRDLLRETLPGAPDLLTMPDALAEPRWAVLSAAAWWASHDLNTLADAGDMRAMTRRINGGELGLADRTARYAKARAALA